jgi:activator of 2-hydroxyglutaryl-CoA dehydratase
MKGPVIFPKPRPSVSFTDNVVIPKRKVSPSAKLHVFLGVDIGSTTTKTVLMDSNKNIIHKQYVQTQGKPIEVARKLLEGMTPNTSGLSKAIPWTSI